MDFDPTCLDFLEHFDRPKTAADDPIEPAQEFDPELAKATYREQCQAELAVCQVEEGDNEEEQPPAEESCRPVYTRGIGWVLAWAGSLAVFAIIASMIAHAGYLFAAEQSLAVAARAAATEATLPRSSYRSVVATAHRRLQSEPLLAEHLSLTMLQNGRPVLDSFRPYDGNEYSIALSVPASYAIPDWLEKLSILKADQHINAEAACRRPGRKLPPHTH